MKFSYFIIAIFLSACATDYGNIIPMRNNTYEIISESSSQSSATEKALKGAEQKCKSVNNIGKFYVVSHEDNYNGSFGDAQTHNTMKAVRDIASFGVDVNNHRKFFESGNNNHNIYFNPVRPATKSLFKDAFETRLVFRCN
ncbi:MAG: hypothetical protein LBU68_01865 [Rickettsiales bacterium]|jgi:hypothetical protein|nr:hypothetical protein [Rickettsiales bacterium]